VRTLLTTTFPKVTLVINAPLQMEREVAALRQQTGSTSSHDLEPMLAAAAAESSAAAVTPSVVEYLPGQLVFANMQGPAQQAGGRTGPAASGYRSRSDASNWVLESPGFGVKDSTAAAGVSP
jgi:general secretion pathway protein L